MKISSEGNARELSEHFFRVEYGRMVAVISKYIGFEHVQSAEDIVQETLLKATDSWQKNGIPENPQAWLYTTAKNLVYNIQKRKNYSRAYESQAGSKSEEALEWEFKDDLINDEQLKMMLACCNPAIPENGQIALILKILCGFSISEIAKAFFTSRETINKRLVRARKQMRSSFSESQAKSPDPQQISTVLKAIYLLFNEGYKPSLQNENLKLELCYEAMRLANIIIDNSAVADKSDTYALLALMEFNAARFKARKNSDNVTVLMEDQDRTLWNRTLINNGVNSLYRASQVQSVSQYIILATISANHCLAETFEQTNWDEIVSLYDSLLKIEDSAAVRLNRAVAVSKLKGNSLAIQELLELESVSDINTNYLFHSVIAELYSQEEDIEKSLYHLRQAIDKVENKRDSDILQKKLQNLVPIQKS